MTDPPKNNNNKIQQQKKSIVFSKFGKNIFLPEVLVFKKVLTNNNRKIRIEKAWAIITNNFKKKPHLHLILIDTNTSNPLLRTFMSKK